MSKNKRRDSFKGSGKMPVTERLVMMSARKKINRTRGDSDVSDGGSAGGSAGGAMVALRLE